MKSYVIAYASATRESDHFRKCELRASSGLRYITYTIMAPVRHSLTGTIVKDSRSYKIIVYVQHSQFWGLIMF